MSDIKSEPIKFEFDKCYFEVQPKNNWYEFLYFESDEGQHARIQLDAIKHVSYIQKTSVFTIGEEKTSYNWHYVLTIGGEHGVVAEFTFRADNNTKVNAFQDKLIDLINPSTPPH